MPILIIELLGDTEMKTEVIGKDSKIEISF